MFSDERPDDRAAKRAADESSPRCPLRRRQIAPLQDEVLKEVHEGLTCIKNENFVGVVLLQFFAGVKVIVGLWLLCQESQQLKTLIAQFAVSVTPDCVTELPE